MSASVLNSIYKQPLSKFTMDEVVTVILSYCVAAKFLLNQSKENLTIEHFNTIKEYLTQHKPFIDFTSEDYESDTFDLISLRVNASDKASEYILTNADDCYSLVQKVIDYLNMDSDFNNMVNAVRSNGETNRVIKEMIKLNSTTGPVVSIKIDNSYMRVFNNLAATFGINSEIGGIGKKDLQNDYGYQSHRDFVNKVLAIDIGPNFEVYYQECNNNGQPTVHTVESATRNLYLEVCRKLNMGFNGALDNQMFDFKHVFVCNILQLAYGFNPEHDCNCLVLHNTTNADNFNINKLYKKLYFTKLEAICPEDVNPSIRIIDSNNLELFQIRFKKEAYPENITGHRYKMYFKLRKLNKYFN